MKWSESDTSQMCLTKCVYRVLALIWAWTCRAAEKTSTTRGLLVASRTGCLRSGIPYLSTVRLTKLLPKSLLLKSLLHKSLLHKSLLPETLLPETLLPETLLLVNLSESSSS